jgi:hypothetical protein
MEEARHTNVKKIKYCGNCNPEVHPTYIRHVVESMAAGTGSETLVLVNGCSRECLSKSKEVYPGRTIMSLNAGQLILIHGDSGEEG